MGGAELQRVGVHEKCWTTEGGGPWEVLNYRGWGSMGSAGLQRVGVHEKCWTTEGGGPWEVLDYRGWEVALCRTVYYNYQQTAHE